MSTILSSILSTYEGASSEFMAGRVRYQLPHEKQVTRPFVRDGQREAYGLLNMVAVLQRQPSIAYHNGSSDEE